MARLCLTLSTLALLAPLAAAELPGDASTRERDIYRPGATYAVMRGSTPEACEAACKDDRLCRAWSLTPPTFRAGPKCELKSAPGRPVTKAATVSGVLAPDDAEAGVASQPERPQPAAQQAMPPAAPATTTTGEKRPAPASERPVASPTRPVQIEPHRPQQPAPAPSADRPWPGMRQPRQELPRAIVPEGSKPLPLRGTGNAPSYSVQQIEALPGDVEDSAGLKGRLPAGQSDDLPEEAEN